MTDPNPLTEASPRYVKNQFPDIVAAKTLWTPLYLVEGGHALGFRCNTIIQRPGDDDPWTCGRVTRTERGMKLHLWSVHRIKQQGQLFGA